MNFESELRLSYYREVASVNEGHGVKLVRHAESGCFYVLKTLSQYDRTVYDFLAEHPCAGIPRIEEMIEDGETLYVVEEYVPGPTLADVLESRRTLSEPAAAQIVIQLCDILRPLHRHEPPIVHRDIKPSNLILKPDGSLVLLDFNAAKLCDAEKARDTILIGTVGRAAPEQYGFASSRPTADIYAIGVLLSELLTGQLPGEAEYPGPLAHVIKKCTRIDPARRYQAVEAVRRALKRTLKPGTTRAGEWLPPGFRSGKLHLVIPAVLWYWLYFYLGLTLNAAHSSQAELWLNRFFCLALFSGLTLFIGNYKNVWATLPLTRSKKLPIRILGVVAGSSVIFIASFVILVTIENMFFR